MIDLTRLFQEAEAQHATAEFPDFPTVEGGAAETQATDKQHISGISSISDTETADPSRPDNQIIQARASARASRRARGVYAGMPEMSELPEKPAPARNCISDYPSRKSEKEREVGNSPPLPAADGFALWRAGLARLDPNRPPCPGYRADEWPRVLSRAHAFLDTFGAQSEALGWTASRLFGVHPEAGIVRADACGALVQPIGGEVRAITATEVSFGHLTHREKPGQVKGSPLWEIGR